MRIGRIDVRIRRVPRGLDGRPLYDWQAVSADQLTTEARSLIARQARAAAKDYHEEVYATLQEAWSTELGHRVTEAVDAAVARRLGLPPTDAHLLDREDHRP